MSYRLIPIPPKPKTRPQWAEEAARLSLKSGNRYGGNPELMLKENPEMDFRNPPKPQK